MSARGQTVKDITTLMRVGEDYVRDVIHAFNERRFDALDPRWSEGHPKTPPSDGRVIRVDKFGPLNLMPHKGKVWGPARRPRRLWATYNRYDGVRHMLAALQPGQGCVTSHKLRIPTVFPATRLNRPRFSGTCRAGRAERPEPPHSGPPTAP
ncbi:helix-turn-helix domain-containing protein [Streptomyces sp. NPDC002012]|uniref:helix-turn-helix domain-containing protein n=1 Tax=Streptomyces sp. NPDC002012 TaxID=3154532 RepID=UPI00331CA394